MNNKGNYRREGVPVLMLVASGSPPGGRGPGDRLEPKYRFRSVAAFLRAYFSRAVHLQRSLRLLPIGGAMGGMLPFRSRPTPSVSKQPAASATSTSSDYRPAAAAASAAPAPSWAIGASRACGPLRLCVCSKRRLQVFCWNDECKTLDELLVCFLLIDGLLMFSVFER